MYFQKIYDDSETRISLKQMGSFIYCKLKLDVSL